ncbi:MAG: hypothetical protein Q8P67_18905 [archaeon]|nr:hypothetical protein [archaeon]
MAKPEASFGTAAPLAKSGESVSTSRSLRFRRAMRAPRRFLLIGISLTKKKKQNNHIKKSINKINRQNQSTKNQSTKIELKEITRKTRNEKSKI